MKAHEFRDELFESLAYDTDVVNYGLRGLLEAAATTDKGLWLADKQAGLSDEQIKAKFERMGIPLPAIAAKDAPAAPAAAPAAPAIKTGDAELDKAVNDKLSKEGKAAAEAYLREIIWQERQQILSSAQGIRSEIAKLKPAQARQVIDILKAQNITEAIRSAHPNIIQQIALAVAKQKPNVRVAIMQDLKLIAGIVSAKKPIAPAQPPAAPAAPAAPAKPAVTPMAAPVPAPARQVAEQRRKQ
jgi:hypothetical protein